MKHRSQVIEIAVLPAIHLCLCALAAFLPDNWNWMWIMLLDAPISSALAYANELWHFADISPLIAPLSLTVLGTIWWLCIGVALSFIKRWFQRQKRNEGACHEGE